MPASNAFEQWLKKNNYREGTITVTLRKINAAEVAFDGEKDLPQSSLDAARRYVAFAAAEGFDDDFTAWLNEQGAEGVTRKLAAKPKRRKLEARSFTETDWIKIREHVAKSSDPRDVIVAAMATTSLRIGDVLRIPRKEIERGLASGSMQIERKGGTYIEVPIGVLEPWDALSALMSATKPKADTVAALLYPEKPRTDSDGAPYKQVARRLKELGELLGLEGRVHLHRIRRTVAVRALETTNDIRDVQELMGHANVQSTYRYVDEKRTKKTAELQKKLAGIT